MVAHLIKVEKTFPHLDSELRQRHRQKGAASAKNEERGIPKAKKNQPFGKPCMKGDKPDCDYDTHPDNAKHHFSVTSINGSVVSYPHFSKPGVPEPVLYRINQALGTVITILGSHYIQHRGSPEDWQSVVALLVRILPSVWLAVEPASNVAAWGGSAVFWGYLAHAAWGIYNTASTAGIQPAVELLLINAVGMSLPYCFQTNVHWLKNCLLEKLSSTGKAAEMLKYIEPWMNALFMLGYTYYVSPSAAEKSTRADFIVDEAGNVISIEQKAPEHVRVTEQQGKNITIEIPDLEVTKTYSQGGQVYVEFENGLTMIYLGEGVQCIPHVSCDKKIIFIPSDQSPVIYSIDERVQLILELKEFDSRLLGFDAAIKDPPIKEGGSMPKAPWSDIKDRPLLSEALPVPEAPMKDAASFADSGITVIEGQSLKINTSKTQSEPLSVIARPEAVEPVEVMQPNRPQYSWGGISGVEGGVITAFTGDQVGMFILMAALERERGLVNLFSPSADTQGVELSVDDKRARVKGIDYFPQSEWQGVARHYDTESAQYTDYRYQIQVADNVAAPLFMANSKNNKKVPVAGLVKIVETLTGSDNLHLAFSRSDMPELKALLPASQSSGIVFDEAAISDWLTPDRLSASVDHASHLLLIEPCETGASGPALLFIYSRELHKMQLFIGLYGVTSEGSAAPQQVSEARHAGQYERVSQAVNAASNGPRHKRDVRKPPNEHPSEKNVSRSIEPEWAGDTEITSLPATTTLEPVETSRVLSVQPFHEKAHGAVIQVMRQGAEGVQQTLPVSLMVFNPVSATPSLFSRPVAGQIISENHWLEAIAQALGACFKAHHKSCPAFADAIGVDSTVSDTPKEFRDQVEPTQLNQWITEGKAVAILKGFNVDGQISTVEGGAIMDECHFDAVENKPVGRCPAGKQCLISGYTPMVYLFQDKEGVVTAVITQQDAVIAGCKHKPELAYKDVYEALNEEAIPAIHEGGLLSHQPPSCIAGIADTMSKGCFPLYAPTWMVYDYASQTYQEIINPFYSRDDYITPRGDQRLIMPTVNTLVDQPIADDILPGYMTGAKLPDFLDLNGWKVISANLGYEATFSDGGFHDFRPYPYDQQIPYVLLGHEDGRLRVFIKYSSETLNFVKLSFARERGRHRWQANEKMNVPLTPEFVLYRTNKYTKWIWAEIHTDYDVCSADTSLIITLQPMLRGDIELVAKGGAITLDIRDANTESIVGGMLGLSSDDLEDGGAGMTTLFASNVTTLKSHYKHQSYKITGTLDQVKEEKDKHLSNTNIAGRGLHELFKGAGEFASMFFGLPGGDSGFLPGMFKGIGEMFGFAAAVVPTPPLKFKADLKMPDPRPTVSQTFLKAVGSETAFQSPKRIKLPLTRFDGVLGFIGFAKKGEMNVKRSPPSTFSKSRLFEGKTMRRGVRAGSGHTEFTYGQYYTRFDQFSGKLTFSLIPNVDPHLNDQVFLDKSTTVYAIVSFHWPAYCQERVKIEKPLGNELSDEDFHKNFLKKSSLNYSGWSPRYFSNFNGDDRFYRHEHIPLGRSRFGTVNWAPVIGRASDGLALTSLPQNAINEFLATGQSVYRTFTQCPKTLTDLGKMTATIDNGSTTLAFESTDHAVYLAPLTLEALKDLEVHWEIDINQCTQGCQLKEVMPALTPKVELVTFYADQSDPARDTGFYKTGAMPMQYVSDNPEHQKNYGLESPSESVCEDLLE